MAESVKIECGRVEGLLVIINETDASDLWSDMVRYYPRLLLPINHHALSSHSIRADRQIIGLHI